MSLRLGEWRVRITQVRRTGSCPLASISCMLHDGKDRRLARSSESTAFATTKARDNAWTKTSKPCSSVAQSPGRLLAKHVHDPRHLRRCSAIGSLLKLCYHYQMFQALGDQQHIALSKFVQRLHVTILPGLGTLAGSSHLWKAVRFW